MEFWHRIFFVYLYISMGYFVASATLGKKEGAGWRYWLVAALWPALMYRMMEKLGTKLNSLIKD